MNTPADDFTDPQTVRRELLDPDQSVRDAFAQHLAAELDALAARVADCFRHLQPVLDAGERVNLPRTNLAIALALGVLDDVVVATKLLTAGKLPAAGNVMRQAIEGVAMTLLCSTDQDLVIVERPKQGDLRGRYWELVMADDRLVQGQRAVEQLGWNAATLGVNPDGVAVLQQAQRFFHPFSHCGRFTLASRAALEEPGRFHLGGHFDVAKLPGYRVHLQQHIGLCSVLPPLLDYLLAALPPANAAPAAAAIPNPPAAA
ncbi:hypothetical protein WL58_16805 [Burkholderia cepacia]|uniref:hypothetical protein n=1 Tax=Burkholderia cepacia TaxID=292 RepID=UPI000753AD20|nr:hypothetical protein [Burkholderia cepacia]KWC84175.1 hypothetical protein WL58_16805 [Burkholderia cepacia]